MTSERFRTTMLVALAVAGLALAACGDDGGSTATTSTSPATSSTAAASTVAATRTTAATPNNATLASPTTLASTTTEAAPDPGRVVSLAEEGILADLLSIGVQPVASSASVETVGFSGMDGLDTTGIEVLPMTTLNLEQLAAMRPDTIVTLQFWVDQVGEDVLKGVAGRLVIVPDGLPIPERLAFLGKEFGRESQAAEVTADLAAAEQAAATKVPDDCTVSVAAIYPGPAPAAFVDGPWDLPTAVLATGCKLDPDASVAAPDRNGRVYLSTEQLSMLDAPHIVLLQNEAVDGESAAVAAIEANALWANLPAVQAGNVTVFDRLGYPGAAGQIRFFEDFAAAVAS